MQPSEHLNWLEETVEWFLAVDRRALSQPVARCPGWQVDTVYDHLGRGVGIARVAALQAPPDADVFAIMGASLPAPARGEQAFALFADAMPAYLELLETLDPTGPCATYAGRGEVAFWIRRDAIDETIEFALPMALRVLGRPSPAPCRLVPSDAPERVLGSGGAPSASMAGSAYALLLALWGRGRAEVDGDDAIARAWTSLIEEAFRGPSPS